MVARKKVEGPVEIKPLAIKTIQIEIIGVTPLIVHAWSEKARREMLEKQTKKTREKKGVRDPNADYEKAFYHLSDGRYGFPAAAFKAAIVGAARLFEGIPMTLLRPSVRVQAEDLETGLVAIRGEPHMREDPVRLPTGVADLRYRPEFRNWEVTLTVTYLESVISLDQLMNLVNAAGLGGVGEWRPEKSASGSYGCFKVKTT